MARYQLDQTPEDDAVLRQMLNSGWDTYQIARMFDIDEAEALRRITRSREAARARSAAEQAEWDAAGRHA